MTTTKRKALHGRTKDCLNYIMNLEKTKNGTLVTGINCSPEFAYEEMCMVNRLYGNSGNRVGYHIFQNFNYLDDITPEKAHELGVQLANELYPDYQCVVATHVDKAHIHNHICINSINVKTGKKLVDKLNHPEGIANLRLVSDRISRENGLTVIEEAPPIGKYKQKNFLYHYANKNWRKGIQIDIDQLIDQADSLDHLLELLASRGYRIKKGKNIQVRPIGSDYFFKLNRIGKGQYSENKLKQRIFENKKIGTTDFCASSFSKYKWINHKGKILDKKIDYKTNLMIRNAKYNSIIKKQDDIVNTQNLQYNKYQERRYKIKRELNHLKNIINTLSTVSVKDYKDLMLQISDAENIYSDLKFKLEDLKDTNYLYQDILPFLKIYMELYSLNELIEEEGIINNKLMKHNYQKELHMFEETKKEINKNFCVDSLEDAKNLMVKCNQSKREFILALNNLKEHTKRLNALYDLKNYTLDRDLEKENSNLYKGFSIDVNMIDKERSTEELYCIRIPYTKDYIYISRQQCSWIKFEERLQLYLIEEQQFKVYDENDNQKYEKTSEEICEENVNNIKLFKEMKVVKNR